MSLVLEKGWRPLLLGTRRPRGLQHKVRQRINLYAPGEAVVGDVLGAALGDAVVGAAVVGAAEGEGVAPSTVGDAVVGEVLGAALGDAVVGAAEGEGKPRNALRMSAKAGGLVPKNPFGAFATVDQVQHLADMFAEVDEDESANGAATLAAFKDRISGLLEASRFGGFQRLVESVLDLDAAPREFWVTAFGYPSPSLVPQVLSELTPPGAQAGLHRVGAGPWVHVRCETWQAQQAALSKNGRVIAGFMLGVIAAACKDVKMALELREERLPKRVISLMQSREVRRRAAVSGEAYGARSPSDTSDRTGRDLHHKTAGSVTSRILGVIRRDVCRHGWAYDFTHPWRKRVMRLSCA